MSGARSWFALLDGLIEDQVALKRHFTTSAFVFEEIDGRFALSAPSLDACPERDHDAAIDAATELLDGINVSLRLSVRSSKGFELHGLAERRDGIFHRVMMSTGGAYTISGAAAVGIVGQIGSPRRSREERLTSLIQRDERIHDIAHKLAVRPATWNALNRAFETVCGVMSQKTDEQKRRGDFENLANLGWASEDESNRFYHTAAYFRKGYPRSENRAVKRGLQPMTYDDARVFIDRLFWRLVEEKEPS